MYGKKRNKVVTVRVDEDLYNEFLKTIERFTEVSYLFYYNSKKTIYRTHFPDSKYDCLGKYTLADLVDVSMKSFVEKYKEDM